jgi:HPr kinase/phosphorylase
MAEGKITVLDLLDPELQGPNALNLRCVTGRQALSNVIEEPNINRPGLALSGFYDAFAYKRVQVFGRGETAYLGKNSGEGRSLPLRRLFQYAIPCCVFTHSLLPPQQVIEIADEEHCPILSTGLESTEFSTRLLRFFADAFASEFTVHAVLIEVFGVGILVQGGSGIGKSEAALELIERGHRLVADDSVRLRSVNGNTLVGRGANRMVSHHMEIRGLGILNVAQLYGVGAIRDQKEVQLVVKLSEWDGEETYTRLGEGLESGKTEDILGVKIPLIEIPIRPGRNVPILIETAAKNERLKARGYYSAAEFNKNIMKWIEQDTAKAAYYGGDDSY